MNKIPSIVRNHGKLYRIGKNIIKTHNALKTSTQYDMQWKNGSIHDVQSERIEEFTRLSDTIHRDWELHHDDLHRYWTGLS